jgi:hypothetical protein
MIRDPEIVFRNHLMERMAEIDTRAKAMDAELAGLRREWDRCAQLLRLLDTNHAAKPDKGGKAKPQPPALKMETATTAKDSVRRVLAQAGQPMSAQELRAALPDMPENTLRFVLFSETRAKHFTRSTVRPRKWGLAKEESR